jgi:hypothetical protein
LTGIKLEGVFGLVDLPLFISLIHGLQKMLD